jgi:tetraacyldisaccharide 4'-kinase
LRGALAPTQRVTTTADRRVAHLTLNRGKQRLDSVDNLWQRRGLLQALLFPLSAVFALAVRLRRAMYRAGVLHSERIAVPVIVVGNITVGGSGKTPMVLWLVDFLRDHGIRPGIVSRGYGGRLPGPESVGPLADPASVGDEPLLLARRSGCPVWVGRDRVAAARALLEAEPSCEVIVTDDGLQHYRLARDFEIAVVDAERRFGNGWLLPAGPLREPTSRLDQVDAIVWNGEAAMSSQFGMRLTGETFFNVLNPDLTAGPAEFHGKRLHAVAGIGNPQRFFDHLRELGLEGACQPFPDHHPYRPEDLDAARDADAVLMTEKDAVKCAAFATERFWALPVQAEVDSRIGDAVLRVLRE